MSMYRENPEALDEALQWSPEQLKKEGKHLMMAASTFAPIPGFSGALPGLKYLPGVERLSDAVQGHNMWGVAGKMAEGTWKKMGNLVPKRWKPDSMKRMHEKLAGNRPEQISQTWAQRRSQMDMPRESYVLPGNTRAQQITQARYDRDMGAAEYLRSGKVPQWQDDLGSWISRAEAQVAKKGSGAKLDWDMARGGSYRQAGLDMWGVGAAATTATGLGVADKGRKQSMLWLNSPQRTEYLQTSVAAASLFEGGEFLYRSHDRLGEDWKRKMFRKAYPNENHNELFYWNAENLPARSEESQSEIDNALGVYNAHHYPEHGWPENWQGMARENIQAMGQDKFNFAGDLALRKKNQRGFYSVDQAVLDDRNIADPYARTESYNLIHGGNDMDQLHYLFSDDNVDYANQSRAYGSRYGEDSLKNKQLFIRQQLSSMENLLQKHPAEFRSQYGQATPEQWRDLLWSI